LAETANSTALRWLKTANFTAHCWLRQLQHCWLRQLTLQCSDNQRSTGLNCRSTLASPNGMSEGQRHTAAPGHCLLPFPTLLHHVQYSDASSAAQQFGHSRRL